jgi:hypothetical protein
LQNVNKVNVVFWLPYKILNHYNCNCKKQTMVPLYSQWVTSLETIRGQQKLKRKKLLKNNNDCKAFRAFDSTNYPDTGQRLSMRILALPQKVEILNVWTRF